MIERVAVVVPAADEQDRIGACLASIERARRRLLGCVLGIERVDLFVVLDGCRDGTPAAVARFGTRPWIHPITSSARRVGAARRLGAQRAIESLGPSDRLWLANTDADSAVPAEWLTEMVATANTGIEVVLGTVLPGTELPHALRASWLAQHRLTEGHPYVHGANFGIRADTYLALGGWPAGLASNEDIDLARRASDAGARILRSAAVPVTTSARMAGQAPHGFSSYLRDLRDRGSTMTPQQRTAS